MVYRTLKNWIPASAGMTI